MRPIFVYKNGSALVGVKTYYELMKPGMIYGNAVIMMGGFLFASKGQIDLRLLLAVLIGQSLIIASGCVFNNYIDRDIDARMERTRDRVSARGLVSPHNMLASGTLLGLGGGLALVWFTNVLTFAVALFGFFAYVFLYTLWTKRYTVHSTIVGSLAGATPPVIGYTAVTGHIDLLAIILFLILVLWQMPHFYAIGIRRLDDYKAASLPIMPVTYGVRTTKILMLLYILLFAVAVLLLPILRYVGYVYLFVMLVLSIVWLKGAVRGFRTADDQKWAKSMFLLSLVIILSFSPLIAFDWIV